MPIEDHDDLDSRFNAIVGQIDDDQAARMRATARRIGRRPRRVRRIAVWVILTVVVVVGALVALRPDLLVGGLP
ncbi:hypothetical protein [Streptosporangium sp. KLBMP 9127]|nr:hypothetical protein [Streptosporangium sp. KLBMP 9127]